MSHFTALVIGEDIDKQLAPYHEFECTGDDNEYVQDKDITQEILDHMKEGNEGKGCTLNEALDHYGLTDKTVFDEAKVKKKKLHKYGYVLLNSDGSLAKAIRRTNENSKWDWYQVGGRWNGYFKMKPGANGELGTASFMGEPAAKGFCDSALKKDIDFESMRSEAGAKAAEEYDSFHAVVKGRELKPWDEFILDYKDIEEARTAWHSNPVVKDIHKWIVDTCNYPLMETGGMLKQTKEQYVQSARDGAVATFAVVKDGKWYQRGQMGCFASVRDEMSNEQWQKQFAKLIDTLPDDTRLTIVDCHT